MSKASWEFEIEESARGLIDEVRRETDVVNFDLAVILGSGWQEAARLGEILAVFNYDDWPCFAGGQIEGHGGQLFTVRFRSWNILFFSGRLHCYQGLDAFQASLPVRLAGALGCRKVLLTCATGGINQTFKPGDFMLVEDHINLLGGNPLRGLKGNIFVDLTDLYDKALNKCLADRRIEGLTLHRGILAAMPGPSFETPAEINLLRIAGADVVSMSTVPEAIMSRYLGMQVAAVAFVANHAAGLSEEKISHQDVLARSVQYASLFPLLLKLIIETWQAVSA